jgi:hypothetical protein
MVPEDPFPHNASSSALSAGGLAGSGGLEQEQHVHILLVEGDGRACAPAQVAPGATHPPSRSPKIHAHPADDPVTQKLVSELLKACDYEGEPPGRPEPLSSRAEALPPRREPLPSSPRPQ